MRPNAFWPAGILAAALTGGCAGIPGQTPDLAQLEERARAFWAARQANDLYAAYQYEDIKPLGTMTLQQYMQRGGNIRYKKVQVGQPECPQPLQTCTLPVDIEYLIPALGRNPLEAQLEDRWTVLDGQWYRTTEPNTSPIKKQKNR